MHTVGEGDMPPFSADELLKALGLDDDTPDGRTMGDRLTGTKDRSFGVLRGLFLFGRQANRLVSAVNEGTANPAQEALAKALGAAVTAHITREGDVCRRVGTMAADCTRDDLVPPDVRANLLGDNFELAAAELGEVDQTVQPIQANTAPRRGTDCCS